MFDARLRRVLDGPLDRLAGRLDHPPVTPDRLTILGLALGLGSAVTSAFALWPVAAVLWLASRAADGLDGPLARRRARRDGPRDAGAGGFLDITCDFVVYGATVVGVGIGAGGELWPFLLVLLAYYVNGTAFLAFSSIAERAGRRLDDGRSLSFLGGLAEGAETIAVHTLWLALPFWAEEIATIWAAVVALSATHRVAMGYHSLR